MRSVDDILDQLSFEDAEALSVVIQHYDDRTEDLKCDRDQAIERAMRAEQALVEMKLNLQRSEAEVSRLSRAMAEMQQSLTMSQIKLGGIAMLLQGK
jgi:hypothetical protein